MLIFDIRCGVMHWLMHRLIEVAMCHGAGRLRFVTIGQEVGDAVWYRGRPTEVIVWHERKPILTIINWLLLPLPFFTHPLLAA